jgi:hypothetical protein
LTSPDNPYVDQPILDAATVGAADSTGGKTVTVRPGTYVVQVESGCRWVLGIVQQ